MSRAEHWEMDQEGQIKHSSSGKIHYFDDGDDADDDVDNDDHDVDDIYFRCQGWEWWNFVAGHCLDEDQNNQEVELYTCSGATWQVLQIVAFCYYFDTIW